MNVAKSEALQSKAYTVSNDFNIVGRISTSSQWAVVDNYTINATFNGGAYLSTYGTFDSASWKYASFSGYSGLGYKLEYSIVVYAYNSNTKLYESAWIPNNEICYLGIPDWVTSGSSNTRQPRFEIYLRRDEFNDQGERRWLVPSDMRPSTCVRFLTGYQDIEEQTLPADWFATTTQTNLFIPLVTVTTPIETYQGSFGGGGGHRGVIHDLDYYLEIPQEVAGVVQYLFYLFGQISSLKYVTTLICLVMVLATIRFIMR